MQLVNVSKCVVFSLHLLRRGGLDVSDDSLISRTSPICRNLVKRRSPPDRTKPTHPHTCRTSRHACIPYVWQPECLRSLRSRSPLRFGIYRSSGRARKLKDSELGIPSGAGSGKNRLAKHQPLLGRIFRMSFPLSHSGGHCAERPYGRSLICSGLLALIGMWAIIRNTTRTRGRRTLGMVLASIVIAGFLLYIYERVGTDDRLFISSHSNDIQDEGSPRRLHEGRTKRLSRSPSNQAKKWIGGSPRQFSSGGWRCISRLQHLCRRIFQTRRK